MALPDWFHDTAAKVNNWGRWGDDDEIGTLNLITPDVTRQAANCVATGHTFSLAWPLSFAQNLQLGNLPGRSVLHTMTSVNQPMLGDPAQFCSSDDIVTMGMQTATHWDGLAHVSYDGRIYNGYGAASVGVTGASRLGIDTISSIVSRGVLLDVARVHGVDRLAGGTAILPDDLDAAEAAGQLTVRSGDVVLIRTGHVQVLMGKRIDVKAYAMENPGLGWQCAQWFHDRDVAAVAIDNLTFDPYPLQDPAAFFPLHLLDLVEMGMLQGQNWILEDLAADCAADGVYEFLLEASPQPFTGAVGSPVNPVAVK